MANAVSFVRADGVSAPPESTTDEQLVSACISGNQLAWEQLIARYRGLIRSFARKYGAPAPEAADIFQTVCIELYVALPRLRNHDSVRAWIATIAAHETYRWKRRHLAQLQRDGEIFDCAKPGTTPLSEFLQSEQSALVRQAVAHLPDRYRMLIGLLFLTEPPLPYRTVALRLGVMPGSVPFLRQRGLRKLRLLLAKLAPLQPHAGRQRRAQ